jgi:hypothetical protein
MDNGLGQDSHAPDSSQELITMRVFISSVVNGFEVYREAARRAVENIAAIPVMCEDFGARPYSSERACLTEIEGSDAFVLLMGERFGFETELGISVTQQEFRHALHLGLPILVFVQQGNAEERQLAFRQEVEAYHSGFCRETFTSAEQLKDRVVRQLVLLGRTREAVSEQQFQERLAEAFPQAWHGHTQQALFRFAFLPQPPRDLDLRQVEEGRDDIFSRLAALKLAMLRAGYQPIDAADHSGISSERVFFRQFDDGLLTYEAPASGGRSDLGFGDWYVPPSHIRRLASACFKLVPANAGWFHIGLSGMDHSVMQELPEQPRHSFSMPMRSSTRAEQNKLLIPSTEAAFAEWSDRAVARLEREFGRA